LVNEIYWSGVASSKEKLIRFWWRDGWLRSNFPEPDAGLLDLPDTVILGSAICKNFNF